MRRLKIILRSKYSFKIILIICILYSLCANRFIKFSSKYDINTKEFNVIVNKIDIIDNKINMIVKGREKLRLVYYYKDINDIKDIHLGDRIKVNGILEKPLSNSVFNVFNYKLYLYNNNIFYILKASKIKKIENNSSLIYDIRTRIDKRLKYSKRSYGYLKSFILGNKSNLGDYDNIYSDIGVMHLFSISGMHISLFVGFLLFFIRRIFYNRYLQYLFIFIFLIVYGFILDFPASFLRAFVMFFLFSINRLFNLKINKIDLMFLVFSICIVINPFIILNIGFQFSYIISFGLVLFYKKIYNIKNIILRSIYVSYICFILSFPICIFYFYQVNIISILLNIVFIPLVSFIIFPLSCICFIIPSFDGLLYFFIYIMEHISLLIYKIEIFKLTFAKCNFIIIILYYFIIFMMIRNYKIIVLFLLVIIIHKNIFLFHNYFNVIYFDVGQGDSSLILFPNNKLNILIDTGGIINSNYSVVNSKTIVFLKSFGIKKLDYLVITHGDYDHMGEAINLVNNFKVDKVIFNCGSYNELEKKLIKVLDKKKIKYYSCIKELNKDKNKLYFLQTKEYDNENDNSNVIYTELNGYRFMFMGDASSTTEKEILDKYNLSKIDVLKVGHHGSRTSSSKEFINEISPKYSVISVGKNNRYGHPNKKVLDNLNTSKVYRTDQDGSIMFKIKNNKLKIKTCSP